MRQLCRYAVVAVTAAEIEVIAQRLGLTPAEVEQRYTSGSGLTQRPVAADDGTRLCVSGWEPVFNLRCPAHTLGRRLASLCPIIYNALEEYRHAVGYHPPRQG